MNIICLDPSGDMNNRGGYGTTGWSIFKDGELEKFGHVSAEDYNTQERYWHEVWNVIDHADHPKAVVMESFRLFGHKAQQQTGSSMDTPQMIGYLRMMCWYRQLQLFMQQPSDKTRVADPQLVKMGILEHRNGRYYALGKQTIIHERDSIRHGVFWHRYSKEAKELFGNGVPNAAQK